MNFFIFEMFKEEANTFKRLALVNTYFVSTGETSHRNLGSWLFCQRAVIIENFNMRLELNLDDVNISELLLPNFWPRYTRIKSK